VSRTALWQHQLFEKSRFWSENPCFLGITGGVCLQNPLVIGVGRRFLEALDLGLENKEQQAVNIDRLLTALLGSRLSSIAGFIMR
jgi:hypothetical protein